MGSTWSRANDVRPNSQEYFHVTNSFRPGPILCFNSTAEADEFWNNTLVEPQLQVRGNFTNQYDLDYFYSQVDPYEQQIKDLGQRCLESETGQYLPYVGTPAAVRDMLALSDELDGPNTTIHYWVSRSG